MQPAWVTKTDPQQHPVRFLAMVWQQRTGKAFAFAEQGQRMGQLRDLRKALGDLTPAVLDWASSPVNWWRFTQQVRALTKQRSVPADPHIGFLLHHCQTALKTMRQQLSHSTSNVDVNFCTALEEQRLEQCRRFVLLVSQHNPERLAKAHEAKTLTDIEQAFLEVFKESTQAVWGAVVCAAIFEIVCKSTKS